MIFMSDVYLLLGSNLGDREKYIADSKQCIENELGPILKESSMYRTAAWGNTNQPDFINQVVLVSSAWKPQEVLSRILGIETYLGRARINKWGARTIDIDILFYADQCIDEQNLIIPHPYLHQRNFTLIPLLEIAPDLYHPVLNKTITELCEHVLNDLSVQKIALQAQLVDVCVCEVD